jgi:hypothetical protein
MPVHTGEQQKIYPYSEKYTDNNGALNSLHGLKEVNIIYGSEVQTFYKTALMQIEIRYLYGDSKIAGICVKKIYAGLPHAFFRVTGSTDTSDFIYKISVAV